MPNIAAEELPGQIADSRFKILIEGELSTNEADAANGQGSVSAGGSVTLVWNISTLPFDYIAGVQPLPGRPLLYPEWLSRDDSHQQVSADPHVPSAAPGNTPPGSTEQPGAGASENHGSSETTGGNDVIFSSKDFTKGDEVIDLKGGDDVFYGTSMAEKVTAGKGNDVVYSGGGADSISMDEDDDRAVLAGGEMTVTGGTGVDMLDINAVKSGAKIDLGATGNGNMVTGDSMTLISGFEQVLGGGGNDSIVGDDLTGADNGNLLIGEEGDDTLEGRGGADILIGGPGADLLFGDRPGGGPVDEGDKIYGGSGDDTLMGNDGDDVVNGGSGSDILYGGPGSDIFEFEGPAESTRDHPDIIRDFDKDDKLDFSNFIKQSDTYSVTSEGGFTTLTMDAYNFAIKFEGTFEAGDFHLVS